MCVTTKGCPKGSKSFLSSKQSSASCRLAAMGFHHCHFIDEEVIEWDDVEKGLFDLKDVAAYYKEDIASITKSNEAAVKVVKTMVGENYEVTGEHSFTFNNICTDDFIPFHSSENNRGDVGVWYDNSVVCTIEVHSSPFLYTIRKVAYNMLQLLRVVKAHKINGCAMIGFAFPKLLTKRYMVKVQMTYNPETRSFAINYEQITEVSDIKNQILGAIEFNKRLLTKCQEGEFYEEAKNLLFLCNEELEEYGVNPVQINCRFGILVEASMEDEKRYCFKKPLLKQSTSSLVCLSLREFAINGMVEYKVADKFPVGEVFYYLKVQHDPLNDKELVDCLYDYIQAVVKVVECLYAEGIVHHDVRVPNVCFDEKFSPILIDFDFCSFFTPSTETSSKEPPSSEVDDFTTFTKDIVERLKKEKRDNFDDDLFLCKLKSGHYDSELLKTSVVMKYKKKTISEVIVSRKNCSES